MRRLLFILIVCCSAVAHAEVTPEAAARALAGYENPVTESRMRALGEGWENAVEAVLRDPNTRPILRPRAIAALGFSRRPSSAAALREVLTLRGAQLQGPAVIETREAVRSLAAVDGPKAQPELVRFVEHEVADVRLAAARGLAALGPAAKDALSSRLRREGDPAVKQVLIGALKQLEP